jgi:hypothetical protein
VNQEFSMSITSIASNVYQATLGRLLPDNAGAKNAQAASAQNCIAPVVDQAEQIVDTITSTVKTAGETVGCFLDTQA